MFLRITLENGTQITEFITNDDMDTINQKLNIFNSPFSYKVTSWEIVEDIELSIEECEKRIFLIEMQDHISADDYEYISKYKDYIKQLKKRG